MKLSSVQLMHTKGCHSYHLALDAIEQAMEEMGLEAKVEVVLVSSEAMAQKYRFTGSPTVKINGKDIEPEMEKVGIFKACACRTHLWKDTLCDFPPKEMIVEAIKAQERDI